MKTILITGASDGIGRACANLLDSKYSLFLFGRSEEKLRAVCAELKNVKAFYCFDAHDREKLYAALRDIKDKGGVDVLINNMGANLKKESVKDMNIDLFEKMLDLNCMSHLICIQELLPQMIEKRRGNIVNILSSSCKFNNPNMAAYTASKKAMEAISNALAKEVKKDGVVVTNVYPGGVDSNFRTLERPDYLRPETVAKQIAFLLENEDGLIQELTIRPVVEDNY